MEITEIPKVESPRELDAIEGAEISALLERSRIAFPDPDGWMDHVHHRNVATLVTDAVLNWGRANSLYPHSTGPACCIFEMLGAFMSRWDISRYGWEIFRPSPRQADVLIVAGTVTWKMAPQLRRLYDQMAEPKWVVAMGACAISGGTFKESYAVVPGVNRLMPVDVYIPGCPPRPEGFLHGMLMLQKKIKKDSVGRAVTSRAAELRQLVREFPTKQS